MVMLQPACQSGPGFSIAYLLIYKGYIYWYWHCKNSECAKRQNPLQLVNFFVQNAAIHT